MKTIQAQVFIQQPPDQVYAFTFDPRRQPSWQKERVDRLASPGPGLERARAHGPAGLRLEVIQETLTADPPSSFTARVKEIHGWLEAQTRWRFELSGGGTLVTLQQQIELRGWLRLAALLVSWGVRHKMTTDLARLKAVLEG